jgi:hypothetical protein
MRARDHARESAYGQRETRERQADVEQPRTHITPLRARAHTNTHVMRAHEHTPRTNTYVETAIASETARDHERRPSVRLPHARCCVCDQREHTAQHTARARTVAGVAELAQRVVVQQAVGEHAQRLVRAALTLVVCAHASHTHCPHDRAHAPHTDSARSVLVCCSAALSAPKPAFDMPLSTIAHAARTHARTVWAHGCCTAAHITPSRARCASVRLLQSARASIAVPASPSAQPAHTASCHVSAWNVTHKAHNAHTAHAPESASAVRRALSASRRAKHATHASSR